MNAVRIKEYTALLVKAEESSTAIHTLWLKEHSAVDTHASKPIGRTLVVAGIPPYVNEECLRRLFSHGGAIKAIFLQKHSSSGPPPSESSQFFKDANEIKGFKVAYIVFKAEKALKAALRVTYDRPRILFPASCPLVSGLEKWKKETLDSFSIDTVQLEKECTSMLKKFDEDVAEAKLREKQIIGVPDKEGWITVTRSGKSKGAPRAKGNKVKAIAWMKQQRAEKELLDFYSFQMRETKKQRIQELKKKFEEDKKRIAEMRSARKFRPY